MPEISRFFGIIIRMFYDEHNPPRFHVQNNENKALISIDTLQIIEGKLSPRVFGLVAEWAFIHKNELLENWNQANKGNIIKKISPLE